MQGRRAPVLFSVQPVIRCMPAMEADVTISLLTVAGNVLI